MNNNIKVNWQEIAKNLSGYNEILKDLLLSFNGKKPNKYENYLWDIIARYRYNIESVIALIPLVINDSRIKLSLNLIVRSLAADVITSFYLVSLYDSNLQPTQALKNELAILTSEYMMFLKEVKNIELNIVSKEYDSDLKQLSRNLFNENGKLKTINELRFNSEDYFKDKLGNGFHFISENHKYKFIKKVSKHYDLSEVFVAYKYCSQFQHFNLMSKKLIENDTEIELIQLSNIFNYLCQSVEVILRVSDVSIDNYRSQVMKSNILNDERN